MPIVHKHLIFRIEANNPPNEDELKNWVTELIEKINMKILAGPIVASVSDIPGNIGPTCVCVIETSHIAVHVWTEDKPSLIQLDVYSCGEIDLEKVLEHINVWEPTKIEYKFLDREKGLTEIQ